MSNKTTYASQISTESIYFNFLEKAWAKLKGGYVNSEKYAVDFAILEILNIPVIGIDISEVEFGFL
jgi:hypothetical protein